MLMIDYDEEQYKRAKKALIVEFKYYLDEKHGLKNLFKYYQDFLTQEAFLLVSTNQ